MMNRYDKVAKADIVILDARRFEEYRTMSIPGGISVPGAELVPDGIHRFRVI
jgi:rhodanese-related sulfurtransferase